jgi:hypothetical protein
VSTVDAALAWLRAQKPNANPRTYHADAAATLLILAGLHDRGMEYAAVADVALYACLSKSAVRNRLMWLADGWTGSQRVVLRRRVGRRMWYRVDVDALAEGAKP